MPSYSASLSAPEIVLWVLQIAIILYVIRRPGRIHEDKSVSPVACAFVLLLAWNFRLIYEFALGSSGFWYFVGDDPSRFLMSYSWSRDPFFITWDGIWQGGTFYLHGAAMRVVRDPMFASKMVSAFYGLFPLLGLYVFTQGLYRNRKLSLAAVLVTAPLWLHLLMSTGALAEMPMVGLMLTGVGLLLMSTYAEPKRAKRLQLLAALSLAGGTAFHMTAWMMLLPILAITLGYALRKDTPDGFGLRRWVLFSMIACSYCVAWTVAGWVKFGDPLRIFHDYGKFLIRDAGGVYPLQVRIMAYPGAIAYTLWGIFPFAIYGLFSGLLRDREEKHRVRWVVAGALGALAIMVVLAVRSDPSPHAYRSTVTLATLLIPIALASLWPWAEEVFDQRRKILMGGASLAVLLPLVLFAFLWTWDNHQRTLRQRRELNTMDSNAIAVGAWLRQEMIQPQLLELPPGGPPVRIWNPGPPWFRSLNIQYGAASPDRVVEWQQDTPGIDSMQPGQYMITQVELSDPRLVRQFEMGNYKVFRFQPK